MDPDLEKLVQRTRGLQPWRRVVHAGCGVGLVGLIWLDILAPLALSVGLGAIILVAVGTDVVRLRRPELNRRFFRVFRHLASPRESRRWASSTWYVIGAAAVMLVFPGRVWIPSILVVALADPCASVCGQLWGRAEPGRPSLLGSAVFWAVATLCVLPFVGPGPAVVIGLVAAAAERAPIPVDDNVTVALVTAVALTLLSG